MTIRWQYISQVFESRHLQDDLDELGEAGWELITAHWEEYSYGGQTTQQARCILKRQRGEGELGIERWAEEPATAGRA